MANMNDSGKWYMRTETWDQIYEIHLCNEDSAGNSFFISKKIERSSKVTPMVYKYTFTAIHEFDFTYYPIASDWT